MKERPILFSGPMVRAILDGTKTQTRRVVKVQPPDERYVLATLADSTARDDRKCIGKHHWLLKDGLNVLDGGQPYFACPYGYAGDRLWVRETWSIDPHPGENFNGGIRSPDGGEVMYCATDGWSGPWRPSIFMPRWASRITLEVTGVRVERLQDISERDAWAEGCHGTDDDVTGGISGYREYYQLWESINGKTAPWASNPWVWVIKFQRVVP